MARGYVCRLSFVVCRYDGCVQVAMEVYVRGDVGARMSMYRVGEVVVVVAAPGI